MNILFCQGGMPSKEGATLNILVTDFSGKPRSKDIIIFEDSTNTSVKYRVITDKEGKATISIPKGRTYYVKLKSFESDTPQSRISIPDFPGILNIDYSIKYELPKVFKLQHIYFDVGKATLRSESFKSLDNLAELLKVKDEMVIEIAGHTDNTGDKNANLRLSQARAEAVRDYLIKKGIAPSRIIARGYGDTQPVATNDTEEGRQMNRRVEIRIIKE